MNAQRRRADKLRGLYAVADGRMDAEALVAAAAAAIRGGARIVQYRDKGGDAARRRRAVDALLDLCRSSGTPLIVNDDVDLAARSGADGVHLGRADAAISVARRRLGGAAVIGASCYNSLPRALAAEREGADYVAFGRFFPSRTKPEAPPAALSLLHQARARLHIPIVAIGGVDATNGAALIAAGAQMLAVVDALFGQSGPAEIEAAARRLAALCTD